MVRTGDIIALTLAGVVIAAAWSTRQPDAPPRRLEPGPGPSPLPPSPADAEALRQAELLIEQFELNVTYMTPEQRVEVARTLEAAADRFAPTSPQAAARLLDAAAKIRRMNPMPIGTPTLPMATPEMLFDGVTTRANEYLAGRTMGTVNAAALASELESVATQFPPTGGPDGTLARRVVLLAYAAAVRNPETTAIFARPL